MINQVKGEVNWFASFGSVLLIAEVTSLTPDLARIKVCPDSIPVRVKCIRK